MVHKGSAGTASRAGRPKDAAASRWCRCDRPYTPRQPVWPSIQYRAHQHGQARGLVSRCPAFPARTRPPPHPTPTPTPPHPTPPRPLFDTHPRPARVSCSTQLSSSMAGLPKFSRTSKNVGRVPVVRPLSRWAVTVGASARKGNATAVPSPAANRDCTNGMRYRGGRSPSSAIKSYRRASTTMTTSCGGVAGWGRGWQLLSREGVGGVHTSGRTHLCKLGHRRHAGNGDSVRRSDLRHLQSCQEKAAAHQGKAPQVDNCQEGPQAPFTRPPIPPPIAPVTGKCCCGFHGCSCGFEAPYTAMAHVGGCNSPFQGLRWVWEGDRDRDRHSVRGSKRGASPVP
jgi:hypothetical protein